MTIPTGFKDQGILAWIGLMGGAVEGVDVYGLFAKLFGEAASCA